MFALSCGKLYEFRPCPRCTPLLPTLSTCLYLKLMLLSGATYGPTPHYPFPLCSRPSILPSIIHFLFLRTRIVQSCTELQLSRNLPKQELRCRDQQLWVERSMTRILVKKGVPPLEERVRHHIAKSLSLHGLVLLQSVKIDLLLHSG